MRRLPSARAVVTVSTSLDRRGLDRHAARGSQVVASAIRPVCPMGNSPTRAAAGCRHAAATERLRPGRTRRYVRAAVVEAYGAGDMAGCSWVMGQGRAGVPGGRVCLRPHPPASQEGRLDPADSTARLALAYPSFGPMAVRRGENRGARAGPDSGRPAGAPTPPAPPLVPLPRPPTAARQPNGCHGSVDESGCYLLPGVVRTCAPAHADADPARAVDA